VCPGGAKGTHRLPADARPPRFPGAYFYKQHLTINILLAQI